MGSISLIGNHGGAPSDKRICPGPGYRLKNSGPKAAIQQV